MTRRAIHLLVGAVCGFAVGCDLPKVQELPPTEDVDGLVIALQPVSEGVQRFEATSASNARLEARAQLTMAFAEGYPLELSLETDTWIDAFGIDCGYLVGEIELASVRVPDGAAISARLQGQRLVLDAEGPGSGTIAMEGTFVPDPYSCNLSPGAEVPLALSVRVDVVEPRGTEFELSGCDPLAPLGVPGRRVHDNEGPGWDFRPVLLDAEGSPFYAANASELAQATVVLSDQHSRGRDGPPATLSQWQAASAPALVSITPRWGEPIAVEVVEDRQISDYRVSYQLPGNQGGGLRTTRPVTDGEVVDFGEVWGTQDLIAIVVESMEVQSREVCAAKPPPAWFDLQSLTPDVCSVVNLGDDASLPVWGGESLGQAAQLERDGTCILELRGPADTMRTFTATFSGLDD